MKVFISWSGITSKALGKLLSEWLPVTVQFVKPWFSKDDIAAGTRWSNTIAKELDETHFGIICVTKENLAAPWILFESGALAKSVADGRVIPLLFDIDDVALANTPLGQFQAKRVNREDMLHVLKSINDAAPTTEKLPYDLLSRAFDYNWASFEKAYSEILSENAPPAQTKAPTTSELLEYLVRMTNTIDSRFSDVGKRLDILSQKPMAIRKTHDGGACQGRLVTPLFLVVSDRRCFIT